MLRSCKVQHFCEKSETFKVGSESLYAFGQRILTYSCWGWARNSLEKTSMILSPTHLDMHHHTKSCQSINRSEAAVLIVCINNFNFECARIPFLYDMLSQVCTSVESVFRVSHNQLDSIFFGNTQSIPNFISKLLGIGYFWVSVLTCSRPLPWRREFLLELTYIQIYPPKTRLRPECDISVSKLQKSIGISLEKNC